MAVSLTLPTVHGSQNTWGDTLNTALTALQSAVNTTPFTPSWVGARSNPFQPHLSLYNAASPNVRKIRALLNATKQGGNCSVVAIGDSITAGFGGGGASTAWPLQWRSQANLRGCTVRGTGISYPGTGNTDSRWSTTGTVTNNTNWMQIAAAGTAQFVSDIAGTNIDIYYFNTSGSFTYKIDGGAPVTVTPSGASTVGVVNLTGQTNTTHTVLITATGTTFLIGVNVYGASGLLVTNAGVSGTKSSDWTGTGFVSKWQQAFPTVGTGPAPDAVLVSIGVNDPGTNSVSTYKTNLQTIVTNIQALSGTPAIVFVTTNTNFSIADSTMQTYWSAVYDVADQYNLPVVDVYDRLGVWGTVNSLGLLGDLVHPNAKGYAEYASAVDALVR